MDRYCFSGESHNVVAESLELNLLHLFISKPIQTARQRRGPRVSCSVDPDGTIFIRGQALRGRESRKCAIAQPLDSTRPSKPQRTVTVEIRRPNLRSGAIAFLDARNLA